MGLGLKFECLIPVRLIENLTSRNEVGTLSLCRKKESVSTSIPLQIQRMRASEVIMALETLQSFGEVHHLLHHLFNLFKRYYYPTLGMKAIAIRLVWN